MKRVIMIILSILLLSGCKYFRGDHCNNTESIIGIYENKYDSESINELEIKSDGTFLQTFKKNNIIETNLGTWKFYEDDCGIMLKGLKLMHKLPKSNLEYFRESGVFRVNTIRFVEDLRKEFDFYRK